MPDRTETVGVRLTPDEREKFEQFLDNSNEFDSLSRFFRTVAHRYIATDDEDPSLDPEEISEAVESTLTPFAERLEQMEEHIVSIDSNVRDDDKIDRLARDIYSTLPTHSDETGLPDLDEVSKSGNGSDLAIVQAISNPYLWAEYYDEDLQDVRRACARMQQYYPDVNVVRDDLDEKEIHVPDHDDIGVSHSGGHTDSHTDVSNKSPDRTRSRLNVSERSSGTIQRFYKTGDE